MNAQEILQLIECDANSFYLAAADALKAFAEILAEQADHLRADDLTTLIAIGSVLHREAGTEQAVQRKMPPAEVQEGVIGS
jgi:hypothetical protein